jgi:thiamine-monophosphate kinase
VGPGDDCAVVDVPGRRLLLTTDALVEGVHFRLTWMTPEQIGRKAYLVNASDIAAMGGQPRYVLVSVTAPGRYAGRDLMRLNRAISAAARATGARVVGGNLTRGRTLSVTLTLIGDSPAHPVLRAGARAGDVLFVTGVLGQAARGLRQLRRDAGARGVAVERFRRPPCRLPAGALLARERIASAMIDVSDGLLQDLGHICTASGVGARIELASLPRAGDPMLALTGGEDYELLYAVPPHRLARLHALRGRLGCPMTRIGEIVPRAQGVRAIDARGRPVPVARAGFDHFAQRGPA